jgi:hypothetical protein
MSGILCSFVGASFGPAGPEAIGEAFGGGFYAGKVNDGGTEYYLIVAPKSSGQNSSVKIKTTIGASATISGIDSVVDGQSNTNSMPTNSSHPAKQWVSGLSIGGFTDWYIPAKNEMEILYYNLKPSNSQNDTNFGDNPNAVPSRSGSSYTNYDSGSDTFSLVPTTTTVTSFQSGQSEEIDQSGIFFTSTEAGGSSDVFGTTRTNGRFFARDYDQSLKVRAVRRVAV